MADPDETFTLVVNFRLMATWALNLTSNITCLSEHVSIVNPATHSFHSRRQYSPGGLYSQPFAERVVETTSPSITTWVTGDTKTKASC